MFTGLIEKVGMLTGVERHAGGYRLLAKHEPWDIPLAVGDSVAVNGACLTVTAVKADAFSADLLEETIRRTSLLERDGKPVNLERAVQANARFGGHFVTGHVDGTGTVTGITPHERDFVLSVRCSKDLLAEMVVKGSIACDGVSLTIARIDEASFDVHIIPHTWKRTVFHDLSSGSRVNLETDLIGKYVLRGLATARGDRTVSMDDLRKAGILD